LQLYLLVTAHLALKTLGQSEVHIHRGQVFNVDQIRAVFHVVTNVDIANTRCAIKGRQNTHALPARAGQRHLRLYHLHVGRCFIDHALGNKALRH
jgi:hypothetical protein